MNLLVFVIKCLTLNIVTNKRGLLGSSENKDEITLYYDVDNPNKDSLEYASILVVPKESPAANIQQISIEEEELKSCSAKSIGLFKIVDTEFDISPLRVKMDKDDNAIFTVHVKTGPSNKLIGFGTKRVYVQLHAVNKDKEVEKALIPFMAKVLLVNPANIKFKRGPGRNLKKIIVPVSSIKANLALKKLIDTFKLSKVETFENGTQPPVIPKSVNL